MGNQKEETETRRKRTGPAKPGKLTGHQTIKLVLIWQALFLKYMKRTPKLLKFNGLKFRKNPINWANCQKVGN